MSQISLPEALSKKLLFLGIAIVHNLRSDLTFVKMPFLKWPLPFKCHNDSEVKLHSKKNVGPSFSQEAEST